MSESSEKKTSLFERLAPVLLIITIGLAFMVGVLWQKVENLSGGKVSGNTTTNTTEDTAKQQVKVSMDQIKALYDKDVIKLGDKDRKVTFVEISDPSCPYCHIAGGLNPTLNAQVGDRFKLVSDGGSYVAPVTEMKKLVDAGKASFIWIYFPGHGNGEMGSKAMYCANEKGKFWAVHDLLMTSKGYELLNETVQNDKSKAGALAEFLSSAMNVNEMKSCLESGKYDERLASDMVVAKELGVDGTPGFYVNDTNFAGAYSYKDMESVVNSAL